jgi:hypothetical protein
MITWQNELAHSTGELDEPELRIWPDQCQHRELAVTGVPGVFECMEPGCGEKIVAPELAESKPLFAVD